MPIYNFFQSHSTVASFPDGKKTLHFFQAYFEIHKGSEQKFVRYLGEPMDLVHINCGSHNQEVGSRQITGKKPVINNM